MRLTKSEVSLRFASWYAQYQQPPPHPLRFYAGLRLYSGGEILSGQLCFCIAAAASRQAAYPLRPERCPAEIFTTPKDWHLSQEPLVCFDMDETLKLDKDNDNCFVVLGDASRLTRCENICKPVFRMH